MSEDDCNIVSASQEIRPGPNKVTRNVNLCGMENYKDMDRNLDNIKLKNPNFQGRNDPDTYFEWEKKIG